jgi:uncharacterized repeat protein (TIGR01451 family)
MLRRTLTLSALLAAAVPFVLAGLPAAAAEPVADLSLAVRVSKQAVRVGDSVVYTLSVGNAGPAAAENVELQLNLGDDLNPVALTCTTGAAVGFSCLVPSIPAGGVARGFFTVTPNTRGPRGHQLTRARAQLFTTTADPNPANNADVVVQVKVAGPKPTD